MKTQIAINDTRQPSLTRAVIRKLGGTECLPDIVNHGASGGFGGFTYYTDTVAFYKRHKADIMKRAEGDASDLGTDVLAMIAGFGCLRDSKLTPWDVCQALNGKGDSATDVQNAMAWYALEEIARELNPDL